MLAICNINQKYCLLSLVGGNRLFRDDTREWQLMNHCSTSTTMPIAKFPMLMMLERTRNNLMKPGMVYQSLLFDWIIQWVQIVFLPIVSQTRKKMNHMKMMLLNTVESQHRIDMSSQEFNGHMWILCYQDHHPGLAHKGALRKKTAKECGMESMKILFFIEWELEHVVVELLILFALKKATPHKASHNNKWLADLDSDTLATSDTVTNALYVRKNQSQGMWVKITCLASSTNIKKSQPNPVTQESSMMWTW